jgi:hypothetical protein
LSRRLRGPGALALAAVCLAASLPYVSTLHAYFLGDDFGLVQLFARRPPFHALTLFHRSWTETIYGAVPTDELRPTLAFSYRLDWMIGGARPTAYHATNIVLHVLNSLLVYAMARGMARLGLAASAFAGALFGVMGVHAEPVAWISGRADSIPTLFYLAAVCAYARWRATGATALYCASVAALFLALFSKQSAITLLPMLMAYDLLVVRPRSWPRRADVLAWLPFAALTAGYLVLRFILFGNFVRERLLTAKRIGVFFGRQWTYFQMMTGGLEPVALPAPEPYAFGVVLGGVVVLLAAAAAVGAARRTTAWGIVLFFGPVWWVLAVTPLVMTYLTPRHLYLASAGVAVLLALGCESLWRTGRAALRATAALLGGVLLVGQLSALLWAVAQWNDSARLSQGMVRDVEREALSAPTGTLFVVAAPWRPHTPWIGTYRWAFALPFVLEPPFMSEGVAARVSVISRPEVHCCPVEQWAGHVRDAASAWSARPDRPPVVALAWAASGELVRRTDLDHPELRSQAQDLVRTASSADLRHKVHAMLVPLGGTGAEVW